MGSFINNLHIRGSDRDAVVRVLQSLRAPPAYVGAPAASTWINVYPKEQENEPDSLWAITASLSHLLACPAIGFSIYDSAVFWYVLYDRGEVIDGR